MHVLRLVICLLPASRLKNALLSLTSGWRVDPTCRLAPMVVWRVQRASLGPHVRVGTGNAYRDLHLLRLDEFAEVGQLNWISAAARFIPDTTDEELRGVFWLSPHASVASRHYIDASGGVHLDQYALLGGVRSTVLTHSLDVERDALRLSPVRIGERSVVLTTCTLLPGAVLGPRMAVAANSVVTGVTEHPETLIAGAPARPVKDLRGAKFFGRSQTRIMAEAQENLLRARMRQRERRQ